MKQILITGESRTAYRILVEKPLICKTKMQLEDNIQLGLRDLLMF